MTRLWSRTMQVVAALLVTGCLLYILRSVLSPVFFAFLLAYMFDPLVDRFEAMRLPRALGIAFILGMVLVGFGLFSVLAMPTITRDAVRLAEQLPVALQRVVDLGTPALARLGIAVPSNLDGFLDVYSRDLASLAPTALTPLRAIAQGVLGGTASVVGALAASLMVPILAFYLLEDFDRIVARVHGLLPVGARPHVVAMAAEVDLVLGQFIRGQLTVMGLLALLYGIAFTVVGVALAVPIGILAGVLSFIPYVGGATALGLALLMSVLHYNGVWQLAAVVGVYSVIQLLEGFVITPKIVGDKLGLTPVWVLFALMVGGNLFGFLGVMLALPTAAVIKVFVAHGLTRYRSSELFLGTSPTSGAGYSSFGRFRSRRSRRSRRKRAWPGSRMGGPAARRQRS